MNVDWRLHPQLAADARAVARLGLSELLLMDDANYPWLILVPRVPAATELIDLGDEEQAALMAEVSRASRALLAVSGADKINVAALGNVVSQLHVHVIARFRTDAAWPRPVWGVAPARPYPPDELERRLTGLRAALSDCP